MLVAVNASSAGHVTADELARVGLVTLYLLEGYDACHLVSTSYDFYLAKTVAASDGNLTATMGVILEHIARRQEDNDTTTGQHDEHAKVNRAIWSRRVSIFVCGKLIIFNDFHLGR